ncbi:hypothetical protein [Natronomonas aquatica]|uniref:hypothetical protein n=1 Tax=Natronomonas aquatica TaxID=2841590 RepID=UPI003AF15600
MDVYRIDSEDVVEQVAVGDLLYEVVERLLLNNRKVGEKPTNQLMRQCIVRATLSPNDLILEFFGDLLDSVDVAAETVEDSLEQFRCFMLPFLPQRIGDENGGLLQKREVKMFKQCLGDCIHVFE